MGKSIISKAMFNSYVKLPEGISGYTTIVVGKVLGVTSQLLGGLEPFAASTAPPSRGPLKDKQVAPGYATDYAFPRISRFPHLLFRGC
jgi:hypothetical protein